LTFVLLSQEFISTDDDDTIVTSLNDQLQKQLARKEAAKALATALSARFEKYTADNAFGPFSSMRLDKMPMPGEMWDIMQEASNGSKIGSQMFTYFLHWMCVQQAAGKFAQEPGYNAKKYLIKLPGDSPPLPEDEIGNVLLGDLKIPKEKIFEFAANVVDSLVVSLAPDLFRCIDTNNDGDMSKEEWEALVEILTVPQPDKILNFAFTIMDKDDSKTLEVDEVSAFVLKFQKIILDVARSAVHIFGRLVIQSTQQVWSDTIFQQLDQDNDGCITFKEMFGDCVCLSQDQMTFLEKVIDFPKIVKSVIAQLDGDVNAQMFPGQPGPLTDIMPADALTRLSRVINLIKEIGNGILSWKGGVDKDFWFLKFKSLTAGSFKQAFEAAQFYAQPFIGTDSESPVVAQMKLFSNCVDEMNAVSANYG
jgi:Ca2+-binding EF-hand superfamily protein